MKTAVIYFTRTGHSKKIADAIAEAFDTESLNIRDEPVLAEVDLLFITGGIYGARSDPAMIEYVKKISGSNVKKAALITSCASSRIRQETVREILTKNNVEVVRDEFVCKGRYLFLRMGHPDITDIKNAVSFSKKAAGIDQ